jgi:hypothetical protein
MALLSGVRGTAHAAPQVLISRLLPQLYDPRRLDSLAHFSVLDFGRASAGSFDFFNQYACRLSVLDAGASLLEWSRQLEARLAADKAPSQQQLRHELRGLLGAMEERQYDIVLLWDTLNHLHEYALPALASLLRRHVHRDFLGHAFISHKLTEQQDLRYIGMRSPEEIQVFASEPARLYAHSRKAVNDALGAELRVRHAVLHGDGRLECILCAGDGSEPRPVITV